MSKHIFRIRKAIGIALLYVIIIIGIFVLQFRSESVILKNIGIMRVSLTETQNEDSTTALKDSMQVNFKGISFTADSATPARLTLRNSSEAQTISLISWEQDDDLSIKFNFTNNVSLVFSVSDESKTSSLSIAANLPSNATELTLPYKPSSGYLVTEQSASRRLFTSKENSYTISSARIDSENIVFTRARSVSSYNYFDQSKVFMFTSIPDDVRTAAEQAFNETISSYRQRIVQTATAAFTNPATLTEDIATAYVAELASQGRLTEAVQAVPDSFKRRNRRTYISSPYFASIIDMNSTLTMANENSASIIANGVRMNSMAAFSSSKIEDYILRNVNLKSVQDFLSIPAKREEFAPTIAEATGIVKVYLKLVQNRNLNGALDGSKILEPVLEQCLSVIESHCVMNGENLTIEVEGSPVSFIQAVETGAVLISYGKFLLHGELSAAGYMIINTAFRQNSDITPRHLAEIYPVLVPENKNYPHEELSFIGTQGSSTQAVWSWTCANRITYSENASGTEGELVINFKQGDSHYLIIKGIKPFWKIEIYGLTYHSDHRFETYNSSGYVYNESTRTLFLKSRHKTTNEHIKFFFETETPEIPPAQVAATQTAAAQHAPANVAAETPAQDVSTESTSSPAPASTVSPAEDE